MHPQEELQQLLERQKSLKQELQHKKQELLEAQRNRRTILKKQIARAQVRINAKQRKSETRKKILMGACAMDIAANDPGFARILRHSLDAFLERPRDRELFDLPPKEATHGNPS